MNQKYFEIFKKYRRRKYERELEDLQEDLAHRGLGQSGIRIKQEERLKADYTDEIEMKAEELNLQEEERKEKTKESVSTIWTNRILAVVAIASLLVSVSVSWLTIQDSKTANAINKSEAETADLNSQPFIVMVGGDIEGKEVNIKNVGGGPASNLFFIKHLQTSEGNEKVAITKDGNTAVALASGAEGSVDINASDMDVVSSTDELPPVVLCEAGSLLNEKGTWVLAIYQNLKGEVLATKFYGTNAKRPYHAVSFTRLKSCD